MTTESVSTRGCGRWKSVVGNRSSNTDRWKPVGGVQEVIDTEGLLDCERPADGERPVSWTKKYAVRSRTVGMHTQAHRPTTGADQYAE